MLGRRAKSMRPLQAIVANLKRIMKNNSNFLPRTKNTPPGSCTNINRNPKSSMKEISSCVIVAKPYPLTQQLRLHATRPIPTRQAWRSEGQPPKWDIRFTLSNYSLQEFGNYVSLRGIKGLAFTCLGSMSKWEPVTFQESLSFVKKVKLTDLCLTVSLLVQARDYMLYISLLDVLNRNDQIPLQAYSEVSMTLILSFFVEEESVA
ncbi:hypothetical protein Zm00014a_020824 [Zea mays]|uniref:Uncharacterized protein n=1 Tax=Zea mays TaxID=4577 RepID=A0A3L6DFG3_MAIZE|nr:hypothetical protein Zm00014a_020824 [Zea mays]